MQWQSVAEAQRQTYDGGSEQQAGRQLILSLQAQIEDLRAELEELEPVIGAALLTATAFRLRDHEGLILALRGLVRSLGRLDRRPAAACDAMLLDHAEA